MKTKYKILKQIDEWLKARTYVKSSEEGINVSLIRFMPFEWEDFKKQLEDEKRI